MRHKLRILLLPLILLLIFAGRMVFRSVTAPSFAIPKGTAELTFLDVGQGNALLIRTAEQNILIDAGEAVNAAMILDELQRRKVRSPDLLIATHPHSDHIGAMAELVKKCAVGTIVMTEEVSPLSCYQDLCEEADRRGVPLTVCMAGDTIPLRDGSCEVLSPERLDGEDTNRNSMVLRLTFGKTAFLLMGDATEREEAALVEQGRIAPCDLLLVGHHGGEDSSCMSFLQAASPKIAVISCGLENEYGHPDDGVIRRLRAVGAEIYRTDLLGTVSFRTDGNTVTEVAE